MKQRTLRAFSMLLAAVLLCIACNFAAFMIDTPDMREHAWQGALMLGEQQGTPQTIGGFMSAQLDNFTAVLILKTAAYVGDETLMQKAFGGYRVDMPAEPGQSEWDAFCNYEFGQNSPTGGLSYSRYRHGYTLPLRLLLCVFNLANLQMLLYFAQLALLFAVLALMAGRGLKPLIPGFFLAYFLLMPFSTSVCLQYIPVTMLMLLACCAVLLWDAQISRLVGMPAFFALLGLLTNYFDLLTFPLVSLGFPLVLLLALRLQRGDGFAAMFMTTAACGICWALGYGGMWALKWLLNAAAFGPGMLYGIFSQITQRVSSNSDEGSFSRVSVILRNLDVLLSKASYLLLIGATGLVTLCASARRAVRGGLRFHTGSLMLLVVAAVPFVWYFVMANHSFDHTYFTYRNLTVSILAGFAFLTCCLKESGDMP